MNKGYVVFRLVLSSIVVLLFCYLYHHLFLFTAAPALAKFGVLGVYTLAMISFLSMPFYFFTLRGKMSPRQHKLLRLAHFSMALLSFALVINLLRDLIYFVVHFVAGLDGSFLYAAAPFWGNLLAPFLFLLLGYMQVRRGPQIVHAKVQDARLPAAFDGVKIAQISDLHIGGSLLKGYVDQLLEKIKEINPDMIVMTGDIIDGSMDDHREDIEKLKSLSAPLGVFYVPGNHEYYWGMRQFFDAFRSYGFHTLINDSVTIPRAGSELLVSGIPDIAAGGFTEVKIDFGNIIAQFRENQFRLLLSHQPKTVHRALQHDFHLQMSGHTHGGQFFPWNWVIHFFEKFSRGLFQLKEGRHHIQLYVNQGTAYWGPPIKLGTVCEVTSLVLSKN